MAFSKLTIPDFSLTVFFRFSDFLHMNKYHELIDWLNTFFEKKIKWICKGKRKTNWFISQLVSVLSAVTNYVRNFRCTLGLF
jgi:hypothetical protein